MATAVSSCGPIRNCSWRVAAQVGRPICIGDRDGDPCGFRAETTIAGMNFCLQCATRLKVALSKHDDLKVLDTDKIERTRKRHTHTSNQRCYAALTNGYLEVAVSVDPERRVNARPGSKLLFTIPGKGNRVRHEIHSLLADARADDLGDNFFELTPEVVDWIKENADGKTNVPHVRAPNQQDTM